MLKDIDTGMVIITILFESMHFLYSSSIAHRAGPSAPAVSGSSVPNSLDSTMTKERQLLPKPR